MGRKGALRWHGQVPVTVVDASLPFAAVQTQVNS